VERSRHKTVNNVNPQTPMTSLVRIVRPPAKKLAAVEAAAEAFEGWRAPAPSRGKIVRKQRV
jgi:hypothetical protein